MKKKITKEDLIIVGMLFLAVIISSIFIFNKFLYNGIDTTYHLSRIIGITNSWKSGDLLAYIHLDNSGYGYAMGFFYSNLFMIIPSILYMLGMNIILIYKIFVVVCAICTAISMYICTKKISKSRYAGIVASFLYTTSGYRIITLVAKGFIGEVLSFIFVPIIILGLYEIIYNNEKKLWVFALGFIGLLNSNLVMTEIMIAISVLFIIFNIKKIIIKKTRLYAILKATIISLLVTSMLWLPMLEQLQKSTFKMKELVNVYNPKRWLLEPLNMFKGTVQYRDNLASAYGLGVIFVAIMLLRLTIKNKNELKLKFCDISIMIGLMLLLCTTSVFPWQYLNKIGGLIQFPSRLEVIITAFFSIASGIIVFYVTKSKPKLKNIIMFLIIIYQIAFDLVCLNSCVNAVKKIRKDNISGTFVKENFEYNICDGVYLPEGVSTFQYQVRAEGKENYGVRDKNCKVTNYEKNGLNIDIEFENNFGNDNYIDLPMNYYYGYVAESKISDKIYRVEKSPKGLVRLYLDVEERDNVKVYYKTTTVQKISICVTILTLMAIIIYVKYNKKKKRCFEKEIPKYIKTELKSKYNEYCLCIPIYNEGERICKELQKANDVNLTKVVDIVLLDGGSTDGTTDKKVLDKYNVNTIIEMEDKGVYKQSEALKAGFDFSIKRKYLGVITVDGNNKDSIEKVPDFIKKLEEGYDYIQGSRYLTGGKEVNTPNVRNFAIKYIHAPIISFICKKKYTDTTNLFRGYSIKYLKDERVQIFRKIFKSYELSTYLSTRADQIGLKTCEIPVERIYPDNKNFPTKVGKIRGNILLLKILFENLFGKFNPCL